MRVLIVDDEKDVRDAVSDLLEGMHLFTEVHTCASEQEVLELLDTEPAGFDIVVLDQQMERLDSGARVLRKLRSREGPWREAAVIVLTVERDPPAVSDLMQAGADDYVFKHQEYGPYAMLKEQLRRVAAERRHRQGRRVFIGHGGSPAWKDLRDLLRDRLGCEWDEFNRVPMAPLPTKDRLEQMLDQACFALLVLTAEDELADGSRQARGNVIHELGLFQGRLGFRRAAVLLEEGCEVFSNLAGLTQIHFPEGNILAASEDIRRVLEREGIVHPATR